jgi:hypothetical protein
MLTAPRIRRSDVVGKKKAVGWTTSMTLRMLQARCLCASIYGRTAKKVKRPVMPDGLEWIGQNIAEQKVFFSEEQIAGIDRAVGHDAELGGARRASRMRQLGIAPGVRKETRTKDRANR